MGSIWNSTEAAISRKWYNSPDNPLPNFVDIYITRTFDIKSPGSVTSHTVYTIQLRDQKDYTLFSEIERRYTDFSELYGYLSVSYKDHMKNVPPFPTKTLFNPSSTSSTVERRKRMFEELLKFIVGNDTLRNDKKTRAFLCWKPTGSEQEQSYDEAPENDYESFEEVMRRIKNQMVVNLGKQIEEEEEVLDNLDESELKQQLSDNLSELEDLLADNEAGHDENTAGEPRQFAQAALAKRKFTRVNQQLRQSAFNADERSLPEGWEMKTNKEGQVYFVDRVHSKSTYQDPRLLVTPPPQAVPLPQGWEMKMDIHGRVWYVDHNNKISTFQDPREKAKKVLGMTTK